MPFKKRGQDKETLRRLYLSFHHRNPSTRDPSTVSYSILLTEKNPSPDVNTCTRFRVTMEASLTDDIGLLEWVFSVEDGQSTRAVRPLSLLLLGKIAPEITSKQIEMTLRSVPVNQAELVWSSSPWTLGALGVRCSKNTFLTTRREIFFFFPFSLLRGTGEKKKIDPLFFLLLWHLKRQHMRQALQRASIIPTDLEPLVLLTNGTVFAQEFGYKPSSVIPTCAPDGQELPSEVPKPNSF